MYYNALMHPYTKIIAIIEFVIPTTLMPSPHHRFIIEAIFLTHVIL